MRSILKCLVAIIFFTQTINGIAQTGDAAKPRGQFIGLFVNNLDSTLPWYTEKIGFTVTGQLSPGGNLKFAMLDWNGFLIEMIQNPKAVSKESIKTANPGSAGTEGFFKLGFYVEDINYWEKYFKGKKVKFKYELMNNERFKMRMFILEDPEGNLLQFYTKY